MRLTVLLFTCALVPALVAAFVLTNTLSVPIASEAVIDYVLALQGCESVLSVNPIVGETNDGRLNDIRRRHVRKERVLQAIRDSKSGPVQEGAVGAGTGTVCFGFKGGVGTSSRAAETTQLPSRPQQ